MQDSGRPLSRKEKLAIWRAEKEVSGNVGGVVASKAKGTSANNKRGPLSTLNSSMGNTRAASRQRHGPRDGKSGKSSSDAVVGRRKRFQVDSKAIEEAGSRGVGPGTPIHNLKDKLRKGLPIAANVKSNPSDPTCAYGESNKAIVAAAVGGARNGVGSGFTRVRNGGGAGACVGGGAGGVSRRGGGRNINRGFDAARLREVSAFLKTQISDANMLLEVDCLDAARELLAQLLVSGTPQERRVGELALYWAVRAKIEEDACAHGAARRILDEGEAYLSMPTQQRVLAKVIAAFEARMEVREEEEVEKLLADSSVDSLSKISSSPDRSISGESPISSAPYRYDPNDSSMEEDSGSNSVSSAIKTLNFARASAESSLGGGIPTAAEAATAEEKKSAQDPGIGSPASDLRGTSCGSDMKGSGVSETLSGLVFSEDEEEGDGSMEVASPDLSISGIDEAVLEKSKALLQGNGLEHTATQEKTSASQGHTTLEPTLPAPLAASTQETVPSVEDEAGSGSTERGALEQPAEAAVRRSKRGVKVTEGGAGGGGDGEEEGKGDQGKGGVGQMGPPEARVSRRRKGTPHPEPRRKSKRGKPTGDSEDAGSFVAQVVSTGKDGKKSLTPVRRSCRFSSGSKKCPTPSPLRKEMEAML